MNEITPTDPQAIQPTQAIDQNPAAVYLASLTTEAGRRAQTHALNTIAELLGFDVWQSVPWARLRYQHTQAIRAQLSERYSPATVNRYLCALRRTLNEARRLGLIGPDDYSGAVDLENVKGERLLSGRALSSGEIGALMGVCTNDPGPAGVRDAAIIALAYICGPRRREIAGLNLEDFDRASGELKILHAKRNKQRIVYLANGAADALIDWLAVRGNEPGALFCAIDKFNRLQPGRLTDQAIYNLLAKRAKQAGVKSFSPHDLRRTFVSDMLDAGVDIATVANMAGHADTNTTRRYDRRGERAKKDAAGKLHVPYLRRTR